MVRLVFALAFASIGVAHAVDFPSVTAEQQQARDSERTRILEDELKRERERLSAATVRNDSTAIARHSADISSIEAELGKRAPVVLAAASRERKRSGLPDAFGGGLQDAFGANVQD